MTRIADVLDLCLRRLESGEDLETILGQFPDLRSELEPLLTAARAAGQARPAGMPVDARRRLRSAYMNRAAELREQSRRPLPRMIPALPRLAITLSVVVVLVLTSTGLVSASSGALPGDQLYGVKRSWEDVRLLFALQPQAGYLLESEFEQERLDEAEGLLASRKVASIAFSGVLMQQQNGRWLISGIPVAIDSRTSLPSAPLALGAPVLIAGMTQSDGSVLADRVQLMLAGAALPPLEPSVKESSTDADGNEDQTQPPAMTPVPTASIPGEASPTEQRHTYVFSGIVQALGVSTWVINGQTVYVDGADVFGTVKVGSEVRFTGYYAPDGRFIVSRIEIASNIQHEGGDKIDSGSGSGSGSDGSGSDGSGSGGSSDGEHEGGDGSP